MNNIVVKSQRYKNYNCKLQLYWKKYVFIKKLYLSTNAIVTVSYPAIAVNCGSKLYWTYSPVLSKTNYYCDLQLYQNNQFIIKSLLKIIADDPTSYVNYGSKLLLNKDSRVFPKKHKLPTNVWRYAVHYSSKKFDIAEHKCGIP